ncbi:MAG: DUF2461 domain-containing protein [Pseudomonadota bacterium]
MSFAGFADANAKFFQLLAKHQDRAWFQAHKAEFEAGWQAPMKELLAEVRAGIDRAYRHCDLDQPKLFRIFRDVRFAKDKSPYKTHVGGLIPITRRGNVTEVPMALYVHVGQPNSFAAAGQYMMDPRSLERYRAAVADEQRGKELIKLLVALTKKGFLVRSHDSYKRMPKGYDADHPRAEHLLRKGLTVGFPELPKGILASPKFSPWLVGQAKLAAPLVEWLTFATH